MRLFSPAKLAVSAAIGLAIAVVVTQRPLTAPMPDTLMLADMTWVEVRSAIERGYTTAIIPSGGIEQNGPHMIVGKHDYIVGAAARRIATELGQTLVAPVVSYVPEGSYDPPSGHMRFAGTLGVPESVFAATLEGIARSLKAGGFKTIAFIADHGGSQAPQADVAARLSKEWESLGVRVIAVDAYYADDKQIALLEKQGESRASIGQHASIIDTSELMAVHPEGVDLGRLNTLGLSLQSNGIVGDPRNASAERGKELLAIRIAAAIQQIRAQQTR